MSKHLRQLAAEYLEVIARARDTSLDADERRELNSVRSAAHDALVAALGDDYVRPFNMERYARAIVRGIIH